MVLASSSLSIHWLFGTAHSHWFTHSSTVFPLLAAQSSRILKATTGFYHRRPWLTCWTLSSAPGPPTHHTQPIIADQCLIPMFKQLCKCIELSHFHLPDFSIINKPHLQTQIPINNVLFRRDTSEYRETLPTLLSVYAISSSSITCVYCRSCSLVTKEDIISMCRAILWLSTIRKSIQQEELLHRWGWGWGWGRCRQAGRQQAAKWKHTL